MILTEQQAKQLQDAGIDVEALPDLTVAWRFVGVTALFGKRYLWLQDETGRLHLQAAPDG